MAKEFPAKGVVQAWDQAKIQNFWFSSMIM